MLCNVAENHIEIFLESTDKEASALLDFVQWTLQGHSCVNTKLGSLGGREWVDIAGIRSTDHIQKQNSNVM